MRMPTPGKIIEPTLPHQLDFSGWKERVVARWRAEAGRDKLTRGLEADEIPDNLWYYLYERFLAAEEYYDNTPKENTVPSWTHYGDL